jgi:hemerythrin-like domain-containing protein
MTIVHNCLIRGINAVYLQCVNVSKLGTAKDKLDFANFAYQWAEIVNEHHGIEETALFPSINEITGVPGLMDGNIDEHKEFHHGLEVYTAYLGKVKAGEEEFDGNKLKAMIDEFMPTLRTHLDHEIDTLLLLEKYADKVDWFVWFEKQMGEVLGNMMKVAEYKVSTEHRALQSPDGLTSLAPHWGQN